MDDIQARLKDLCDDLDRRFRPGRLHTLVTFREIQPDLFRFGFLVKADGGYKDLSDRTRNFAFTVCERESLRGDGWETAGIYAKQFELIMKDTYGWGDKELEQAMLYGLSPNWRDGRMT